MHICVSPPINMMTRHSCIQYASVVDDVHPSVVNGMHVSLKSCLDCIKDYGSRVWTYSQAIISDNTVRPRVFTDEKWNGRCYTRGSFGVVVLWEKKVSQRCWGSSFYGNANISVRVNMVFLFPFPSQVCHVFCVFYFATTLFLLVDPPFCQIQKYFHAQLIYSWEGSEHIDLLHLVRLPLALFESSDCDAAGRQLWNRHAVGISK